MKITQSRAQGFVYRVKYSLYSVALFVIVVVVFRLFGAQAPSSEYYYLNLATGLLAPVTITLWLLLLNSGKARIDEYSIEFSEEGITFRRMGEMTRLLSGEVSGYKVTGFMFKRLVIRGKKSNIAFELSLFTKRQQSEIMACLARFTAN